MRFRLMEVIAAVKDLNLRDSASGLGHCKYLDVKAITLGFESYHHLRETLRRAPPDQFQNISLRLMRKVCASRIPSLDCPYFEFHSLSQRSLGFYSEWIGWDSQGGEVRVPRALDGRGSISGLRELLDAPVYVVESISEALAWRSVWGGTALIPHHLANRLFPRSFQKEHLVVKDPPLAKIKQKAQRHLDNMVGMPRTK